MDGGKMKQNSLTLHLFLLIYCLKLRYYIH